MEEQTTNVTTHEDPGVPELKVTLEDLEGLEAWSGSRRADINTRVRPKIRPLKLLDLPDELLQWIFDCAISGGWKLREPSRPRPESVLDTVRNLRLTCRRFHNTSSHLLLPHIRVYSTKQSLDHLEEVARHASISRGVRSIHIVLVFYNPTLARSIQAFAENCAKKLEVNVNHWRFRRNDDQNEDTVLAKAIKKALTIMESWNDVARKGIIEDDDREATTLLLQAHEHYQQRFAEQTALLCDGMLGRAIASATAQLPAASRIRFGSFYTSISPDMYSLKPDDVDNPDSLHDLLTAPFDFWDGIRARRFIDPPTDALGGLFTAVQQPSRVPLTWLSIEMPMPSVMSRLPPANDEDRAKIRAAVKHLEFAKFAAVDLNCDSREADEWGPLITLLSALLDTASLKQIHLDLRRIIPYSEPPDASLGSVLLSRAWPMLETLIFFGSFHLEEIKQAVTQARNKLTLTLSGYLSK